MRWGSGNQELLDPKSTYSPGKKLSTIMADSLYKVSSFYAVFSSTRSLFSAQLLYYPLFAHGYSIVTNGLCFSHEVCSLHKVLFFF